MFLLNCVSCSSKLTETKEGFVGIFIYLTQRIRSLGSQLASEGNGGAVLQNQTLNLWNLTLSVGRQGQN